MQPIIDLTSLIGDETPDDIAMLWEKAYKYQQYVAGICTYASRLPYVMEECIFLIPHIVVVANFPSGQNKLATTKFEVAYAMANNATEIDMVANWQEFNRSMSGIEAFVATWKHQIGPDIKMKLILESGHMRKEYLYAACMQAMKGGVDFLKTSTGKTQIGATPEAVSVIAQAIKDYYNQTGKQVGLKISGGISDGKTADSYISLCHKILSLEWVEQTDTFRIGIGPNSTVLEDWDCK